MIGYFIFRTNYGINIEIFSETAIDVRPKKSLVLVVYDLIFTISKITINDLIGNKRRLNISNKRFNCCLLYTSPSPRDLSTSRMPSSA